MLYLATNNGVTVLQPGGWQVVRRGLEGQPVTSLSAQAGRILAGTRAGIFWSEDQGHSWQPARTGPDHSHVRWLAFHPHLPGLAFAGTEPAGIYRSTDGGQSWQAGEGVQSLRDRLGWFLPYSPEAGCVRGFAFQGPQIYAAVEVGGLLVSEDQGATWQLAAGSDGRPDLQEPPEPKIHPDVHSIEAHPAAPGLLFAPTGGGFYRSSDGGRTWQERYAAYCRAVWVDPAVADHLLLGPAAGVDANGRIEETWDGGVIRISKIRLFKGFAERQSI